MREPEAERIKDDLRDLTKDLLAYRRDIDSVDLARDLLDIRDGHYVHKGQ